MFNPKNFQRGDLIVVKFPDGFSFHGIVRSMQKRKAYVLSTNGGGGYSFLPESEVTFTLVHRYGLMNFEKIWEKVHELRAQE